MFILDDMLFRGLGSLIPSIPGFDMLWLLETIRDFAEKQLYNLEQITDRIKENRLLFEIGERSEKEFKQIENELKEKMKIAEEVRSRHITQGGEIKII